ncbi:MAG: nucleotide exchange factor GrpE [Candidatus Electrothrix sp. YB6]
MSEEHIIEEEKLDDEQQNGESAEQVSPEASGEAGTAEEAAAENGAEEEQGPDIKALQQELEETRNKMLRIAADAENFKKRMEREKEKLVKYAGENILRELLVTVDNLDRALEQGGAEGGDPEQKLEALLSGVELTRKGLHTMLERFDVSPLDSAGKAFNPDEMDALTMEASDEIPVNHVVTEFAKGYVFKDRVLRHAQVVVSSGPGKEEAQAE